MVAEMIRAKNVAPVPGRRALPQLQIQMFGLLQAWRDGHPVQFRTRKAQAALAYLAAEGGPRSRDHLATLLWAEHDLAGARKNLRTTLSYLRQALGDGALMATHEVVSLDLGGALPVELDLQTLTRVQHLTRASAGGGALGLRAHLEEAVALYRGPFLDGLDLPDAPEFETWLVGQRANWQAVAGELLERLAMVQGEAGDEAAAQRTLERWVALEPGEERAWQCLITLVVDRGDLVGARRWWRECQAALGDLGVAPGPELLDIATRLEAALPAGHALDLAARGGDAPWGARGELPLVGRAGPLATLRRAFGRAQRGQSQVVVLEGEAGGGKTRLAREFLAWARVQGAGMLSAAAFATEGSLPYGPVVGALRPTLERENAPDDLLADVWLAELARLLPELRERYPDLPAAPEDSTAGPARLYEAVARLGLALARRAPLVVFLDDAQWADAGTRDLVRYTVQRWTESGARTLVLVAVRMEDVGTQRLLAHWLGGLERAAPTARVVLERLAREDVLQLAGALTGDSNLHQNTGARPIGGDAVTSFGNWLAEKTGGRPLYITQVLQALVDDGALQIHPVAGGGFALDVSDATRSAYVAGRCLRPPAKAQALIAAHVAHLEETEEELLAAATVLGDSFSAKRALQVAAVDERRGGRALDQLVQLRLLRVAPETDTYSVEHDLLHEALYAALGEARRRRLHRRVLAVLETEKALAAALARHMLAAGLAGWDG